MTVGLYVSIARAEQLIGNIERLTARMRATSSRRAMMLANADKHRARLDALMARLPESERAHRARIRTLAAGAYMTKEFADRIEVYDRAYRRLGVLPPTDRTAFVKALEVAGRIQEGRHPDYAGGASREPGLALWWRAEED